MFKCCSQSAGSDNNAPHWFLLCSVGIFKTAELPVNWNNFGTGTPSNVLGSPGSSLLTLRHIPHTVYWFLGLLRLGGNEQTLYKGLSVSLKRHWWLQMCPVSSLQHGNESKQPISTSPPLCIAPPWIPATFIYLFFSWPHVLEIDREMIVGMEERGETGRAGNNREDLPDREWESGACWKWWRCRGGGSCVCMVIQWSCLNVAQRWKSLVSSVGDCCRPGKPPMRPLEIKIKNKKRNARVYMSKPMFYTYLRIWLLWDWEWFLVLDVCAIYLCVCV